MKLNLFLVVTVVLAVVVALAAADGSTSATPSVSRTREGKIRVLKVRKKPRRRVLRQRKKLTGTADKKDGSESGNSSDKDSVKGNRSSGVESFDSLQKPLDKVVSGAGTEPIPASLLQPTTPAHDTIVEPSVNAISTGSQLIIPAQVAEIPTGQLNSGTSLYYAHAPENAEIPQLHLVPGHHVPVIAVQHQTHLQLPKIATTATGHHHHQIHVHNVHGPLKYNYRNKQKMHFVYPFGGYKHRGHRTFNAFFSLPWSHKPVFNYASSHNLHKQYHPGQLDFHHNFYKDFELFG